MIHSVTRIRPNVESFVLFPNDHRRVHGSGLEAMLGHFSRHADLAPTNFGSFRLLVFVHVNIAFRDLTGSVDVIAVFIQNVRLIF